MDSSWMPTVQPRWRLALISALVFLRNHATFQRLALLTCLRSGTFRTYPRLRNSLRTYERSYSTPASSFDQPVKGLGPSSSPPARSSALSCSWPRLGCATACRIWSASSALRRPRPDSGRRLRGAPRALPSPCVPPRRSADIPSRSTSMFSHILSLTSGSFSFLYSLKAAFLVSLACACRPRSKYFSPVNDRELCPTSIRGSRKLHRPDIRRLYKGSPGDGCG